MYFLELLSTHNSGGSFIQTIIHLLNRRGGEGVRTINWLQRIIMYEKTYDRIFSNDKELLIDIIEDVIDRDMKEQQTESLLYLLHLIIQKGGWEHKYDTVRDICEKLESWPESLTEKSQAVITDILKFVNE